MAGSNKVRRDVPQRSRLGRWFLANRETNANDEQDAATGHALSSPTQQLATAEKRPLERRFVEREDPRSGQREAFIVDDDGNELVIHFPYDGGLVVHKNKKVTYADLRGVVVSTSGVDRVYWRNCDFTGSNFRGARGKGGGMDKCVFDNADLSLGNFAGVSAVKSSWRQADLDNIVAAAANLKRGDFTGAKIRRAILEEAKFKGSIFDGADLSESNLAGADLRNCSWQGVNMSDVRLLREEGVGSIQWDGDAYRVLKARYEKYSIDDLKKHYGVDKDEIVTAVWLGHLEVRDNDTLDVVTGTIDPERHHIPVWAWQNFTDWAGSENQD